MNKLEPVLLVFYFVRHYICYWNGNVKKNMEMHQSLLFYKTLGSAIFFNSIPFVHWYAFSISWLTALDVLIQPESTTHGCGCNVVSFSITRIEMKCCQTIEFALVYRWNVIKQLNSFLFIDKIGSNNWISSLKYFKILPSIIQITSKSLKCYPYHSQWRMDIFNGIDLHVHF